MTNQIRRGQFITLLGGAAAAWPVAARAQQPERLRRIGFLRAAPPPERELQAFLRALSERGYVQGRNFVLIAQWGDGNVDRLSELAVALVNAGVEIMVAEGVVTVRAAAALTATIPIVMTGAADPFAGGLVKSLAHPGGNVTGFTTQTIDTTGKYFQIFNELVAGLSRVAILAPSPVWDLFSSSHIEAAKALGIDLIHIDLSGPEAASAAMRQSLAAGAKGALLRAGPFFSPAQRRAIVDTAADLRFPVMYDRREYVEQGGLVTYAADSVDIYRAAAGYVARILAGEKPGELPVQQPTRFELVINRKTATALGINIPPTLLALADEVIE
jgi:putative tryptophan/tyrosine transport system substrate-binding protein